MERNYAEDQANEVEALESIYCDDIEGKQNLNNWLLIRSIRIVDHDLIYWLFIRFDSVTSTKPHKFSISIRTEEYDAETESNGLACQLVFTYTEKYPDTAPLVEIEDPINFEDDFEEKLLEHVKETVCFAIGSGGPTTSVFYYWHFGYILFFFNL